MAPHGGVPPACPMGAALAAAPKQGFRHIFGEPAPGDRFSVTIGDPHTSDAALAELRRLMGGLARLMGIPTDPDRDGELHNPNLPAGYTYLMQFMAHDLVSTATPLWALGHAATEMRNMRAARLRLDTLYGTGPETCPFAYLPTANAFRERLRLGRFATPRFGTAGALVPVRDIPRAAGTDADGLPTKGMPDTLLVDGRNDDNTNVAQVAALFSALHNAILDRLPLPGRGERNTERADRLIGPARFACAREAATLLYRTALREDLLPRLLHKKVLAHYAAADPAALLDQDADPALPLEFSHGAFRLGHAMVREQYQINQRSLQPLSGVLTRTSIASPGSMPPTTDWAATWHNYFPLRSDAPPMPSRKLRPSLAADLQLESRFGRIDPTGTIGLGYRDLMSATLAGLWSVPALYREVAARAPGLLEGAVLADAAAREQRLAAWLSLSPDVSGFDEAAITAIAKSPPLPFYVLFEAEQECAGERLGPLASVLVAEVIFGTLARDPLPSQVATQCGDLATALAWLGPALLGEDCLGALAAIRDVPALIRLAATASGLGPDEPPFI